MVYDGSILKAVGQVHDRMRGLGGREGRVGVGWWRGRYTAQAGSTMLVFSVIYNIKIFLWQF